MKIEEEANETAAEMAQKIVFAENFTKDLRKKINEADKLMQEVDDVGGAAGKILLLLMII